MTGRSPSKTTGAVTVELAPGDRFARYALRLLGDFCGVAFCEAAGVQGQGRVDLYHGDDPRRPCSLRVPRIDRYTLADVPRVPTPADAEAVHEPGRPFPFDLFAALRFWLADEGNAGAPAHAWSNHDVLLAGHSAQEAVGLREVPIVNAYLVLARHWLSERLGLATRSSLPVGLPPGKRCALVLSHDVDSPIHPLDLRHELGAAARSLARRRRRAALGQAAGAVGRAAVLGALRTPGRHWLFDAVLDAEERRGFTSTFFLAATSRFAPGGTRFDVRYEVCAPRFRRLCRRLAARGAGLGLHIGYGARDRAERIAAERRRLEEVAGRPVVGSRHHYWRMSRPLWPSLEAHAGAGLRYDTSVAFNDAPGYRLGIALPFRPWTPDRQREIPVVQVPTVAMDGALFADARAWRWAERSPRVPTVEAGVARFAHLLEGLKRHEGVTAIDWHEYTSHPSSSFRRYGEAYLEILDLVACDPAVAVVSYDDLVESAERARREDRELTATELA